jgi:hypothetical protein
METEDIYKILTSLVFVFLVSWVHFYGISSHRIDLVWSKHRTLVCFLERKLQTSLGF